MLIIGAGFDSIRLEAEGIHEIESDNQLVLNKKTTFTDKCNTRFSIRNPDDLSSTDEIVSFIQYFEEKLNAKIRIVRADIAVNSNQFLRENSNLIRLLLECVNISRGRTCEVFRTTKGINVDCNLKLSDRRIEITCYNRTDKQGLEKTRLEKRNKDIRSHYEHKKTLENEIKNYRKELKILETFIEKVEHKYIKELAETFNRENGVVHGTFSGFVESIDKDGFLMTANILKGLMKAVGIKQNWNTFAKNFRRTRRNSLNFVSKTKFKNFVKNLEEKLKLV
ncbi:MAG: hypothetical protein ACRCZO_19255 [Cetobacterium sp.]